MLGTRRSRRIASPRGKGARAPVSRGRRASALQALWLLVVATPAPATTVIVPDQFPTIQQALDSHATEILVRPGTYFETPVITYVSPDDRELTLRGLVESSYEEKPVVAGLVLGTLTVGFVHSVYINIEDLHFSLEVENTYTDAPYWNPLSITFSRCMFDRGMNDASATVGGQLWYEFRSCTIDGGPLGAVHLVHPQSTSINSCIVGDRVTSSSEHFTMTNSRVIHYGPSPKPIGVEILYADVTAGIGGCSFGGFDIPIHVAGSCPLSVANSTFIGPGRYGVDLGGPGELAVEGYLADNTIVGFDVGVHLENTPNPYGFADFGASGNRIERCATAGIQVTGAFGIECSRNTILSCGAGAILSATTDLRADKNLVLSCVGDGLSLQSWVTLVDSNVVGRCGGVGISASASVSRGHDTRLRGNTSYLNAGSGYVIAFPEVPVDHNIGYGNGGYGLEVTGAGRLAVGCNDWFANRLGAVQGIAPPPADVAVDPMLCDVPHDDVRLSAGSPLADASGCGTIGALGVGCESPVVGVEPPRPAGGFALEPISGSPGPGPFTIRFRAPAVATLDLEVFDLQGRRIARLASGAWPAGTHAVEWSGRDASGKARAGVYVIRYRFPGGQATRRLLLVR